MKNSTRLILGVLMVVIFYSCGMKSKSNMANDVKSVSVDIAHFADTKLEEPISLVSCKLSNGAAAECYRIVVNSEPHEHKMGPWCPRHIEDSKEEGGIWFEDGKVYDIDGHFVANIAEFYKDEKWKLYNDDGTIKVTLTQEACEGAAKPKVEEIYKNHCVECQPSFYHNHVTTYLIPKQPIFHKVGGRFGRGVPVGIALNGVNYDPPAPTHAILKAHTLAPLDDCGGHVNPHTGYHYHAATGCTIEVKQSDGHAPLIGYAMDGFGIYANQNEKGDSDKDLDECRGHEDEIRGYHYHAGEAGGNLIIGCLSGEYGSMKVSH